MKKIFSLLLALTMLLSVGVFVSAEESANDITISFNTDKINLLTDFGAKISVTNNSDKNFFGVEFRVNFDSSALKFDSITLDYADNCPWEVEILDSADSYVYVVAFADLLQVKDLTSCGIAPGGSLDFNLTFKPLKTGNVSLFVNEAIALAGTKFEDYDLTSASASLYKAYTSKIIGASLQLSSGIELSFSALIPADYKEAKICYTQPLISETEENAEKKYAKGVDTGLTGTYNGETLKRYDFTIPVDPDRLGDSINAYVIYENEAVSEAVGYSVMEYCNSVLTNGKSAFPSHTEEQYEAFETLICDLIQYGADAQAYTKYNTSALVTDSVSQKDKFVPSVYERLTATDFVLTEGTVEDPKLAAISMTLDSNFWLSYKINTKSVEGISFKVQVTTKNGAYNYEVDHTDLRPTEDSETYYLHLKPAAKGIDYVYTVTIFDAAGNEGRTLRYSAKSYVYTMQDDETQLGTLVKSIYNYGKSVEKYASATNQ